ncbi:hypothetical protein KSP35_23245 [Aquihabitans sp. G128]|uniref:hypothetical protein n=1 Tax=Aquihabitans sp. G128 TaxID=2849779 RepID=UPI001C24A7BA|nr:hypothetical protein [Aquihabitans sp. G128]QXC61190.1 hypothetical protein KSP35_23245 [Aquihabitans sp. G128]
MSSRHSLWFSFFLRRTWAVRAAAVLVLLLPIPMWLSRHQDAQDREGRETRTVRVDRVVEQGNDDLVSGRVEDELISFSRPGKTAVGDRVEVYRADGQWRTVDQAPLWVPIAATALCWVFAGSALAFYPGLARRRGWARS